MAGSKKGKTQMIARPSSHEQVAELQQLLLDVIKRYTQDNPDITLEHVSYALVDLAAQLNNNYNARLMAEYDNG